MKFIFFYYVGGWKNDSFFDILQLPHTVISNSEKLTHPTVQLYLIWLMAISHCLVIFIRDQKSRGDEDKKLQELMDRYYLQTTV